MEEGEFFAIETFCSTRKGYVNEDMEFIPKVIITMRLRFNKTTRKTRELAGTISKDAQKPLYLPLKPKQAADPNRPRFPFTTRGTTTPTAPEPKPAAEPKPVLSYSFPKPAAPSDPPPSQHQEEQLLLHITPRPHAKNEAHGKGGFGIKMPKLGFGGGDSSSSSEDDGHGGRIKKVKGGAKIDASLPIPKAPGGIDVKGGADAHTKGGLKPSASATIKGDIHAKGDVHAKEAHAKEGLGLKCQSLEWEEKVEDRRPRRTHKESVGRFGAHIAVPNRYSFTSSQS